MATPPPIFPEWLYRGSAVQVVIRHAVAVAALAVSVDVIGYAAFATGIPSSRELLILAIEAPIGAFCAYLYASVIHELGHLAGVRGIFNIPARRLSIGREDPTQIIAQRDWQGIQWTLYAGCGRGYIDEDRTALAHRSALSRGFFDLTCASLGPIAGIAGAVPLIWYAPSGASTIGTIGITMVVMNVAAFIPRAGFDGWYALDGIRTIARSIQKPAPIRS